MAVFYPTDNARNPVLKELFNEIMDIATGHDHDGTNSKAVTVGTVADNAITTAKINDGALSADVAGRAKMANGFITVDKLATDAVETIKIKDSNVTLAKLATTAKTKILSYQIEDLGAGADITNRVIFVAPAGIDVTLVNASIIPQGTAAGVDDGNTSVIALTDGTNTIVSVTYDADPGFPAAGTIANLGALDPTYKVLSAGEKLVLSITNGATANIPALMLQITYTVADV